MNRVRISFIVANFNGGNMLQKCLESIRAQTLGSYEVIVVDNGSFDRSCELPFFDLPDWQLVRLDTNTGFAYANNVGLAKARGEYIALINNDAVLSGTWAERMAEVMDRDGKVGSVACRIVKLKDPTVVESLGFRVHSCGTCSSWRASQDVQGERGTPGPFGAVATAALYRKAALEKTGYFHSEYFAYYEDTDLALRLALHGYVCGLCLEAVAEHAGSATGKRRSDFHRYHLRRNIELLFWVDMVGVLALKYLVQHCLYEALCFAGMICRGQGLVFLKAKRDALRMLPWIIEQRRILRFKLAETKSIAETERDLDAKMTSIWKAVFRGKES